MAAVAECIGLSPTVLRHACCGVGRCRPGTGRRAGPDAGRAAGSSACVAKCGTPKHWPVFGRRAGCGGRIGRLARAKIAGCLVCPAPGGVRFAGGGRGKFCSATHSAVSRRRAIAVAGRGELVPRGHVQYGAAFRPGATIVAWQRVRVVTKYCPVMICRRHIKPARICHRERIDCQLAKRRPIQR
jgi:hypothetical protein